jgi:hypothetical protein
MARKRVKQEFIPGTEPPRVREIDDAAETYYEAMMERVKLSKDEDEAKQNLIDKMVKHDIERYETPDGLVITVTNKKNVKAKKKNDDNGEEGDED